MTKGTPEPTDIHVGARVPDFSVNSRQLPLESSEPTTTLAEKPQPWSWK
jgi:hypothetical protein